MRAAFRFRDRRVAVDDEKVEARTFRKEGFLIHSISSSVCISSGIPGLKPACTKM